VRTQTSDQRVRRVQWCAVVCAACAVESSTEETQDLDEGEQEEGAVVGQPVQGDTQDACTTHNK
jgi:hypothetical protein